MVSRFGGGGGGGGGGDGGGGISVCSEPGEVAATPTNCPITQPAKVEFLQLGPALHMGQRDQYRHASNKI